MSSKLDTHNVELSVIIPFYNTQPEKYIKCINSLLPIAVPIEIIVVDDGSDKQFLNLCINAFNDKRIRWFHQNNEGVSSARNLGINQAKGKYICFVDSDDEVTPDFVKVINEKINQFDAEWVLFDVKEKNETNNVFHDRKIVEPVERHEAGQGIMCDLEYHKALEIYLNSKKLCECWGKLILRRCIIENQIKFRQGMLIGEDALFNAELLQVIEKVQYIALCGYLYNYTDRSAVRLLKDPFQRFEFLTKRFQTDIHLIDTRISPEKREKIKARKKYYRKY